MLNRCSGILGRAPLDSTYDTAAGICDQDRWDLVHSKRAEYIALA